MSDHGCLLFLSTVTRPVLLLFVVLFAKTFGVLNNLYRRFFSVHYLFVKNLQTVANVSFIGITTNCIMDD